MSYFTRPSLHHKRTIYDSTSIIFLALPYRHISDNCKLWIRAPPFRHWSARVYNIKLFALIKAFLEWKTTIVSYYLARCYWKVNTTLLMIYQEMHSIAKSKLIQMKTVSFIANYRLSLPNVLLCKQTTHDCIVNGFSNSFQEKSR